MNKFYGLVTNVNDLKQLERDAQEHGKHAIVFTKKGNAYIWNDATKEPVIVPTLEDVASILETDVDTAKKIIDSKGKFVVEELEPTVIDNSVESTEINNVVVEEPESQVPECTEPNYLEEIDKKLDRVIELLETDILE